MATRITGRTQQKDGQASGSGVFPGLSERVERFRQASRRRGASQPPRTRQARFEEGFFGRWAGRPYWERYARSLAYALESQPVYLFPEEELVGMIYQVGPAPAGFEPDAERLREYDAWVEARERIAAETHPYMADAGSPGHVGWRWEVILEEGIEGLVGRLREHLAGAQDAKAKRLYRGAIILWEGVLRWNERHVAALRERLEEAEGEERERLGRLVERCERAPRYPARSFREAVQAFHMQYLAVMFENPYGGNGPGRMDQLLWPYLERDLAEGRITQEEAKDLVDELLIRFEERLQGADGWVEAVLLGGSGPDGSSAVNLLSEMFVQSTVVLNQTHPSVYTRLGKGSPESFLDLNVHYLLEGNNRAQIYNEETCLAAIMAKGVPWEDAVEFMAGGCMEISVQGRACDLNWARTHNVAKSFELFINGGVDLVTGERRIPAERTLGEFGSFEELYEAFEEELRWEYGEMVRGLDLQSECMARKRPCFLLSSLTDDCLGRGREQQDGGARYHDYGYAPLGATSVADALTAIRAAVFEEGFVSGEELLEALRGNFAGRESLRRRLLRLPKYGQQDGEADAMCDRVMRSVCRAAESVPNRFGGHLKPMFFNFTWTPGESARLGARADGSQAGEMIGHGMTPTRRGMTEGIAAALGSCCSLDFTCVSGGATTMWDMDADWINFERMKAILRVFLEGGGMIFQGNTTEVRELERALENPEQYPHLIVRVGGFSARFTSLDRGLQEEIVRRYRHRG